MISRNPFLRRLFYAALGALFLRQWHVRAELKQIARMKKVHESLDAGSGFGQYTHLMARLFPGARILAVDVKTEQVEDCRFFSERIGQKNVAFEWADLVAFRKPDSFDLALSVDVMEHILEDEAVFANIFASLRPGGLFLINTPAADEKAPPLPPGEVHSVIGEHVRQGYTRQEFMDKMKRAGFEIEKLKLTYGPVWGRMAWTILQHIPMLLLSRSMFWLIIVIPWMLLMYLPAALCMKLDVSLNNAKGGGWLMVARKPAS